MAGWNKDNKIWMAWLIIRLETRRWQNSGTDKLMERFLINVHEDGGFNSAERQIYIRKIVNDLLNRCFARVKLGSYALLPMVKA
jgi:hypothetical protein